MAITGCKCLPLSGLTADTSVSQIFSSLFIPLAWLRIWIMFVYCVVLLFPNGISLIHKNTRLVLFLNSCTKCLKGKNKKNCEMNRKKNMPLCITYLIFQRFTKPLLWNASAWIFCLKLKLTILAKIAFSNSVEVCCFLCSFLLATDLYINS